MTADMDLPAQLTAVCTARALVRDQAPAQCVMEEDAGVEQDARSLDALAKEAYGQVQAEADVLWRGIQEIWRDTTDEQRLRDVGREAADDTWRDAVLLWAEEQGARALRDVGWEAVQEAREEGHEGLGAGWQERWLGEQDQTWKTLEEELQEMARQREA